MKEAHTCYIDEGDSHLLRLMMERLTLAYIDDEETHILAILKKEAHTCYIDEGDSHLLY